MKAIHSRDEKNRLQMGKIIDKTLDKDTNYRTCFLGDHIMICSEVKFEQMIEDLAEELGSEDLARLVLSGESIEFELDKQGRFQMPKDYLQGALEEKECYVISVKGKTKEDNYVEIFPKSIYEKLIEEFVEKTSFVENAGLKGQMNKLKGEVDEERRREN